MTVPVAASTFSSALQQGQVISYWLGVFAMPNESYRKVGGLTGSKSERVRTGSPAALAPQFDGKNVEQIHHLPAQQEDRKEHDQDRHQFPETHTAAIGFQAPGRQAQNIQRRKTEYYGP